MPSVREEVSVASEGVFRFMTVRPARPRVRPPAPGALAETSGLFRRLSTAAAEGAGRERLREIARSYPGTAAYREPVPEVLDLAPLRAWFQAHERDRLARSGLDGWVRRAYGTSLAELAASAEF